MMNSFYIPFFWNTHIALQESQASIAASNYQYITKVRYLRTVVT